MLNYKVRQSPTKSDKVRQSPTKSNKVRQSPTNIHLTYLSYAWNFTENHARAHACSLKTCGCKSEFFEVKIRFLLDEA